MKAISRHWTRLSRFFFGVFPPILYDERLEKALWLEYSNLRLLRNVALVISTIPLESALFSSDGRSSPVFMLSSNFINRCSFAELLNRKSIFERSQSPVTDETASISYARTIPLVFFLFLAIVRVGSRPLAWDFYKGHGIPAYMRFRRITIHSWWKEVCIVLPRKHCKLTHALNIF